MVVLRSTKKVAMTGIELTSHTTVGRVGYPLNHPGDGLYFRKMYRSTGLSDTRLQNII